MVLSCTDTALRPWSFKDKMAAFDYTAFKGGKLHAAQSLLGMAPTFSWADDPPSQGATS